MPFWEEPQGGPRFDLPEEHLVERQDRSHQVVEVMGYTRGQLSDGLHLLGLEKHISGYLQFGNIFFHHEHMGEFVSEVEDRGHRNQLGPGPVATIQDHPFTLPVRPGPDVVQEFLADRRFPEFLSHAKVGPA